MLIELQDVCITRGSRDLLVDLNWALSKGDRVGLVGANGAGKSTLMRCVAGLDLIDAGAVRKPRHVRVGYLPQEGIVHEGQSLRNEAHAGMVTLGGFEREMNQALEALKKLDPESLAHGKALGRYEAAEAAFRGAGGYAADARVDSVLRGLGFAVEDLDRDCAEFSGGWQMRIALARLLLEQPEVLLLDEPTNHLDIEARTWLEHFLGTWQGAVVVVSHDRDFLDRVVTRIGELGGGGITSSVGSFSKYLEERGLRLERLRSEFETQQIEIRRMELFIRRFRAKATKAAQVQSRVRSLAKLQRVVLPPTQERIHFRFRPAPKCGPWPLSVEKLSKRYGPIKVLEDVQLTVGRTDRMALVGPNGVGKSTLLRLLAEREVQDEGRIVRDSKARVAYFAQDQAVELDPKLSVLDAVREACPKASDGEARSVLGAFLFRGDDVHKPCAVLSGGERNRVALVRVLMEEANLLLLDEPTNHLDLQAKESLLDALSAFDGAVVFVSHDREFTQALGSTVVEVGGGGAQRFDECFEDFLWRRALELGHPGPRVPGTRGPDLWFLRGTDLFEVPRLGQPRAQGGLAYKERKKLQRRKGAVERWVLELEKRSLELASQGEALDLRMSSPELARDHTALQKVAAEMVALKEEETKCLEQWQEASEELEHLEDALR